MTTPANHDTKARAVKETWGPRCNVLLFISTEDGIRVIILVLQSDINYRLNLKNYRSEIANGQIRSEKRPGRIVGKDPQSVSLRLGSLSR